VVDADFRAEDRVAPLAERDEIVEALEDDVLLAEMLTVPSVLQPVPCNGLLGIGDAPGDLERKL
jgi:hypothetical protein